jgi:hypothetical protein
LACSKQNLFPADFADYLRWLNGSASSIAIKELKN